MKDRFTEKLKKFDRRGWTLKSYKMWGPDKPCPPRLVVNIYKGCEFKHKYCYIGDHAKPQKGFRDHLKHRIQEAKKLGLENLLVLISSSTEPLQPIEKKYKDTLFALEELLGNGFPVLIMTRNPQMLLEYSEITKNPKLFIDISIPSLHENDPLSIFHSAIAPPLEETFDTIRKLSEMGKYVRVKIEPIVPTVEGIQGQTQEELREIVRLSKKAGAQKIISKTMRLNQSVPQYNQLIDYYRKKGVEEKKTTALYSGIRKKLLTPVLKSCEFYEIPFCACVDSDVFPGKKICFLKTQKYNEKDYAHYCILENEKGHIEERLESLEKGLEKAEKNKCNYYQEYVGEITHETLTTRMIPSLIGKYLFIEALYRVKKVEEKRLLRIKQKLIDILGFEVNTHLKHRARIYSKSHSSCGLKRDWELEFLNFNEAHQIRVMYKYLKESKL